MFWRFIHLSLWGSGLGLWLLGYAVLIEPALLFTRHVDFVSDKYEGPELRIGLITDIHINSPPVPQRRVKRLVESLNDVSLDIVLIPGDFIAGHEKKKIVQMISIAISKGELNIFPPSGLQVLRQLVIMMLGEVRPASEYY